MSTTSSTGVSQLNSNQFLQLLVAQLQNQDPLNPVSPQDFVTQLSTLNSVEGLNNLNTSFSQMLQLQQLTQGASLIGKTVNYTPTGGVPTTGTVSSVSASNGQFVLTVGSNQVSLSQIQSVN